MRIFHVITAIQPGGAEIIAQLLAKYAKHESDEVIFVVVKDPKGDFDEDYTINFSNQLAALNVKTIEISPKYFPLSIPFNAFRFAKKYKLTQEDILHLHTDIPEFFGSFVRLFCRVRIIRTIHNTKFWSAYPLIGFGVEYILNGSIRVGVTKRALVEHNAYLSSKGITPKGEVEIIYNGIDISAVKGDIATKIKCSEKKINFLFIGRLEEQKGPDILLEALKVIDGELLDKMCIHIIGDGSMREFLVKTATEYKLPILFHGALHNASRYIPIFDCVIVPSRFEGFGLVAVESILQGCKVLAMDAPGLSEVFEGTNEELIPINDIKKFADMIAFKVQSPDSLILNKETEMIFSSKYRAEVMGRKYLNLYGHA